MGADVAQRTVTGPLLDQPPRQRRLGVGDPVLEVLRTDVPDLADAALGDQLPGERDGGDAAVGEADHGSYARRCALSAARPSPGLVDGVGEGLLAEDVLAGGERR